MSPSGLNLRVPRGCNLRVLFPDRGGGGCFEKREGERGDGNGRDRDRFQHGDVDERRIKR